MKDALLYKPTIAQTEKSKTLIVVLASVLCIGFFLGGLIVLGKLQDQQETTLKEVKTREELRLDAKAKELNEQEQRLKEFKKLLSSQLGAKSAVSASSNPLQNLSEEDMPLLEETEESALTDPDALTK